ncbi:snapalysin family zinc-dependent metalloprotease [Kytococcus schroeteri]|uniref:snapalysin family zinc-dependent metalloprotease n=1 Tax=Kytococcus schroeteri TaxID=138300 RepID=UPI0015E007C3|nr:snapalysin family zinc-dependent metalloprotease [Kytococcus schroeteri]
MTAEVEITDNDDAAPTYDQLIDSGAEIWNSAVSSIHLVDAGDGGQAMLTDTEGDDLNGSWVRTWGFGEGEVFIDHAQAQEYDAQPNAQEIAQMEANAGAGYLFDGLGR